MQTGGRMNAAGIIPTDDVVRVDNAAAASRVVLICEHASHFIPARFNGLGLSDQDRKSHAAWDPGALAVALHLSSALDAKLVSSRVSRLVYDCNRPPDVPDATPARSEVVAVPGNVGLDAAAKADRVASYYQPFQQAVAKAIAATTDPILVTVHSFTPIYHGQKRDVEIGVLHDTDRRLADVLLTLAPEHTNMKVLRNQPYGPEHGVTHTLKEHGLPGHHPNVMLEIRNDLIATQAQQAQVSAMLAGWLAAAQTQIKSTGAFQC